MSRLRSTKAYAQAFLLNIARAATYTALWPRCATSRGWWRPGSNYWSRGATATIDMRDAGQNEGTQRVRMLREVVPEVVMGAKLPGVMFEDVDGDINERRRAEADWMLDAIVGAIAAGKLPPDDACAWAKIAACEIELLGLAPAA